MTSQYRDALYNLAPDSAPSPYYGRGVLVGVVASLMTERKIKIDEALEIVGPFLPATIDARCIPYGWEEKLRKYTTARIVEQYE